MSQLLLFGKKGTPEGEFNWSIGTGHVSTKMIRRSISPFVFGKNNLFEKLKFYFFVLKTSKTTTLHLRGVDLNSPDINLLKLSKQRCFTKELLPEAAIQRLFQKIILNKMSHQFEKKWTVFLIK